jgi:hypothetical protein
MLEQRRSELLQQVAQLGDLRPGSVTGFMRRCGKPTCHCAQPESPGHGPSYRLSHYVEGKQVSESLASAAARRKAEREVAEYKRFQELSRAFVAVNEQICALRPVDEDAAPTPQKKNGRSDPARSRRGSRTPAAGDFRRKAQQRRARSRSTGDGRNRLVVAEGGSP